MALKELKKRGFKCVVRLDPVIPLINEKEIEEVLCEVLPYGDHIKLKEKEVITCYGNTVIEDWIAGENSIFRSDFKSKIYNGDNKVVFFHVEYHEQKDNHFHDWQIIASLSGQEERRRQRILLA